MIVRHRLWSVMVASIVGSSVFAQAPDNRAELARLHRDATEKVRTIIISKVASTLGDLGATTVPALSQADIQVLSDAMQDADYLHGQLSPEVRYSAPAPARDDSQSDSDSHWECREIVEYYRGPFGRCLSRCVTRWVLVQTEPDPAPAPKAADAPRRPLRDNIIKLLTYFAGRIAGTTAADTSKDRAAALQALSVLLNLDPFFDPGELRVTQSDRPSSPAAIATNPARASARRWTDATGTRTVVAMYLGRDGDTAWFRTEDGRKTKVAIDRLSIEDREFIATQMSQRDIELAGVTERQ